ncbi:MAG: peptidoglycan/xylan/chitin deacetylase (PgdA/CDA1 family) [Saprospiraceae bacterium]|jgi:peptidoglycan/xylan/chitin deacetylase (PgdA/CDA1 family)
MYLVKTPKFIQDLFPNYLWRKTTEKKVLYLTFDDGPIPHITPWVLKQLAEYNAHGTFFCVGDNIKKHPKIFEAVKNAGHTVGNHTMHHLNGWTTDNLTYFHNTRHCARLVNSDLFRPPYGRLKPKQADFLQRHYNIVMWDVLSGDFDENIDGEDCFQNVLKHTKNGSIIVFHDSVKAFPRLEYVLPKVLAHYSGLGYKFEVVAEENGERKQRA